MMLMMMIKI